MLEAHDVVKRYGALEVLHGVSLTVDKGQIAAIVGPSGAGKTTLLQILGTLESPDTGRVVINGQDVTRLGGKALARFRNQRLGFIFQFHNLLPEFTALENVLMPALLAGAKESAYRKPALELLERLGLTHRADHRALHLSGGEQQRVAVARALINKPAVVLADEPSGNLDTDNASALHDLFFTLRDEMGQTMVLVTHNPDLAARCDVTFSMKDGRVLNAT